MKVSLLHLGLNHCYFILTHESILKLNVLARSIKSHQSNCTSKEYSTKEDIDCLSLVLDDLLRNLFRAINIVVLSFFCLQNESSLVEVALALYKV